MCHKIPSSRDNMLTFVCKSSDKKIKDVFDSNNAKCLLTFSPLFSGEGAVQRIPDRQRSLSQGQLSGALRDHADECGWTDSD